MMRPRRRHYRRMNGGLKWKPIFVLLLLIVALLFANHSLQPIVNAYAENEARALSVQAVSQAVMDQLTQEGVTYDQLAQVSRNSDGAVTEITTDMVRMNLLKSSVLAQVQQTLEDYGHKDVSVPVGTLMGNEFMHGWGPSVPFRITLSGNVNAEYQSKFESAGINQTKHQICLVVKASIYTYLPGFSSAVQVETAVPIAETIIVGQVPQFVANLNGNSALTVPNSK